MLIGGAVLTLSINKTLGRREQKKLALREKIIEESLHLIEIHGIEGMTIDAICDCTDIAKKTFYNYYSSKHDLLIDICKTELVGRSTYYNDLAQEKFTDASQQIAFIFEQMLERLTGASITERELIDYMVGSLSENREEGVGLLSNMNTQFHSLFEKHQAEIKPEYNASFCAEMTVGMINSITLNWLNHDDYPIKERFTMLTQFIQNTMLK